MKHFLAAATAAAVVGSLGVSVAGAVNDPAPTTPTTAAVGRRPHRTVALRLLAGALDTSAKAIGITRHELHKELRDHTSIAAVASAHDLQPQAVVDALVAAGAQKIDAAKAAHRISDERAAKLTAALPARAEKFVQQERQGLPGAVGTRLDAVAGAIGIDRASLLTELRAGKTIAQVATAHGVDPQHVIAVLVEGANKRIAQREQARQQRAGQRISKLVNEWKLSPPTS